MRNSKVKGFTLVELIVVIAIIAILAAILVPNMLGYIKNSRFSQADANAKNVHTAATAAIAQAYADGKLGVSANASSMGTKVDLTTDRKITINTVGNGNLTLDLTNGLGETFKGNSCVWYDGNSFAITGAAWAASSTIPTAAVEGLVLDSANFATSRDKTKKTVPIVGYFPIPDDPSTSAGTNTPASGT